MKKRSKNLKKISIRWKVFSFLAIFTLLILLILWVAQTVFLDDIYKTVKLHDLKKSALSIENALTSGNLEEIAEKQARDNEICILVQDEQGKMLVSTESLHNCVIHNISYRDRARLHVDAKSLGGELTERFKLDAQTGIFKSVNDKETTSEENIIYTKVLQDKDKNEYVIFINSILTPVNATVKTLNTILIFVSVILILIALIMSFLISFTITRPIKKLTVSANQLAGGDYNTFFPPSSSKEINTLSDTLNYTAQELKKSDSFKKELIANVSHDLRTPLTLITGYSEIMRDIPDEMTSENLQIIIDESKRLSSLVNDIMDISKLQSNTADLKLETFDVTELLKATSEHYQRLVTSKGYDITFISEKNSTVTADRQKILQVIYNLINNAVTHTGDDKKITVKQTNTTHYGSDYVRIEITDTGDGIEPDKLPLIWDRYYKVDKFHKRNQMGSGLGLSIVKSIIELHYGYYGVYSTVGQGSTFWFELPETKI